MTNTLPRVLDLHMHSTVSDGTDSPAEILANVKAAGIGFFSLTDHDAVQGCEQLLALMAPGDPLFIPGVEFSCKDELGKYHILGYGYDPAAPSIRAVVAQGHALRMQKVRQRLEILGTKGRLLIEHDRRTFERNDVDEREWCFADVPPFAAPKTQVVPVETDGQNGQHAAVLSAFAAHILRGEPLVADAREGIRGLMLSNAMHLSGWTGETVSLPIDEQRFLQLLNERRAGSRRKEGRDVAMDTAGSFGRR